MGQSKEQWIERTGGFRFGESNEQFQARVSEILEIEKRLKKKPTMQDVNRLRFLKEITHENGEFVDEYSIEDLAD